MGREIIRWCVFLQKNVSEDIRQFPPKTIDNGEDISVSDSNIHQLPIATEYYIG